MSDFAAFARMENSAWNERQRAADYVGLFSKVPEQAVGPMLEAVDPGPGEWALDLCCGQGAVARALAETGCTVVGIDFSKEMLALARSRVVGAAFVEADAQQLPFGDRQFDIVVSNVGIPHVPDQGLALAEARRVLRPGGRFAMTAWCGPDDSPCMRTLFTAIRAHGSPRVSLPIAPDFHQFAQERFAGETLRSLGFLNVRTRRVDCVLALESPEQLWDVFARATARAAALLAAQPPDCRSAIRTALTAAVREQYGVEGGWRLSMPAMLTSASR